MTASKSRVKAILEEGKPTEKATLKEYLQVRRAGITIRKRATAGIGKEQ